MRRERSFKAGLNGLARRKLTVSGYLFGSQPIVELRILDPEHKSDRHIDLSLPQARQTLRLLLDAIKAASDVARHDGTSLSSADRESGGETQADVRRQAEA